MWEQQVVDYGVRGVCGSHLAAAESTVVVATGKHVEVVPGATVCEEAREAIELIARITHTGGKKKKGKKKKGKGKKKG